MSQPEIQRVAIEMGRCRGYFTHCKFLDITPRNMIENVYELFYNIIKKDYHVEDFR